MKRVSNKLSKRRGLVILLFAIMAVVPFVATRPGSAQSGSTPSWSLLAPTGGPPSGRAWHTSVYDTTNNRMIVFGGGGPTNWCSVPQLHNDVWVLANADGLGGTPNWTQLFPTGSLPGARGYHDSVYDPATNRMIVFGGDLNIGFCFSAVNDVWVLTNANGLGGSPAWTQLTPSGGPPQLRQLVKAVYNSVSNRLIVFSGNNNGCVPSNTSEVWVLNNANGMGGAPVWTQLAPTGGPPAPRTSDSLVYDAANNRLIVFAGDTATGSQNDVWVLANADGSGGTPNWTQLAPSGSLPSARSNHTAVYNSAVNEMVIFGGFGNAGRLNDVWMLTNANGLEGTPAWTEVATTGGPPSTRRGHSAVYNPISNRMTVFAGLDSDCVATGDSWVLSDVTTAPTPTPSPTPTPEPTPQVGPPTNTDQCKNGGWRTFNTPRTFKNQGDCIQFANTGR